MKRNCEPYLGPEFEINDYWGVIAGTAKAPSPGRF